MESEFECLIGYRFRGRGLMEEALEEVGPEAAGNERLALLGDKVLDLMLLNRLYGEDTTTEQGTHLLQAYACNRQLTSRARTLDLQKFIHQRPRPVCGVPDHTLATTVEALLGAVWLDSEKSVSKVNDVMNNLSLYPS